VVEVRIYRSLHLGYDMKYLWLIGWIFLVGCVGGKVGEVASPEVKGVSRKAYVDEKSGNLIALWMNNVEGEKTPKLEAVLVESPYAMFICWPNPEYVPKEQRVYLFIMYDNVRKKCWLTRDYGQFLQIVDNQPKNITIEQLDTCTVSQCYLPPKERKELETVLAGRNIQWGQETQKFCTCRSDGELIFPGDKKP